MGDDNPTTEYTVMPTIQWMNKKPIQIFISADEAKPLRPELVELINHEDSDVRNWARSIIEPFEICYISKDNESEFETWKLFTPWMCTIEEDEEIQYKKILSTSPPNPNVIEQITEHFSEQNSENMAKWLILNQMSKAMEEQREHKDVTAVGKVQRDEDHNSSMRNCQSNV